MSAYKTCKTCGDWLRIETNYRKNGKRLNGQSTYSPNCRICEIKPGESRKKPYFPHLEHLPQWLR